MRVKTKCSLFVCNLPGNPIVRVAPIAYALEKLGFSVEVLGFLPDNCDVYRPYRDQFDYRTVRINPDRALTIVDSWRLARLCTGDVVYAFKPLWTSFFPALIASAFGRRRPLLLDVEDDDTRSDHHNQIRQMLRVAAGGFKEPRRVRSQVLHPFTKCCTHLTVSTTRLQERYGGTILLHGPNELRFNPDLPHLNRDKCRAMFGLPAAEKIVLFAGQPRRHKGFATIVDAVARSEGAGFALALAGDESCPEYGDAQTRLGPRCIRLGAVNNARMPELLSAVDIVPVPQLRTAYAEAQLPAKLLEAMAMRKAVVVSRVGDLPKLVGEDSRQLRGWVIDPGDGIQLANCFREIAADCRESQARGRAARKFYLENASTGAIASRLSAILCSSLHRQSCAETKEACSCKTTLADYASSESTK